MVDLSTTYMGMSLRTPLVASASPLSHDVDGVRRLEDAGAAAVVLYSLFEEQLRREQFELDFHLNQGTESFAESLTYFPEIDEFEVGAETYLKHIRDAKAAVEIPVIASLNGSSLGGWTLFAKQIEEAGADALELNLYNIAADMDRPGTDVEEEYIQVVTAVREHIGIPLSVKLSPFFSNTAHFVKQLEYAGADAVVLFNRFYQPDINLEDLEVVPNVLLSTPQALRLPLRWIGILFGRVEMDFAATSGVHTAEDAIKLLMVGANVTMMASALIRNGVGHIETVEQGMLAWLSENEYESVNQLRGSMSQINNSEPGRFERVQYMRAVTSLPEGYGT